MRLNGWQRIGIVASVILENSVQRPIATNSCAFSVIRQQRAGCGKAAKGANYSGQIGSHSGVCGRSELRGVNAMAAPVIQVGGQWDIRQDNGFRVSVNINQEGDQLDAFCTHSGGSVRSREATGFVRGEDFALTITWDNGTKGEYTGSLQPGFFTGANQGILKGRTKDLNNPGSQAKWESERVFARL
jgi:hypothetical protein